MTWARFFLVLSAIYATPHLTTWVAAGLCFVALVLAMVCIYRGD